MARIRSIHPEACDSRKLSRLSDAAERLYWRLQTHCDDDGRCEDDPQIITARCAPKLRWTDEHVDALLEEMHTVGLATRYTVGGRRLIEIAGFTNYQKPRRKQDSKWPPIPADNVRTRSDNVGIRDDDSRDDTSDMPFAQMSAHVRTLSERVTPGGEWRGEDVGEEQEGESEGERAASPRLAAADRNRILNEATDLALELLGRRTESQTKANPAGWLRAARDGVRADLLALGAFERIDQGATAHDLAQLVTVASAPIVQSPSPTMALAERNMRRARGEACPTCRDTGQRETADGFVPCDHRPTLEAVS